MKIKAKVTQSHKLYCGATDGASHLQTKQITSDY